MKKAPGVVFSLVVLLGILSGGCGGTERVGRNFSIFVLGDPQINLAKWGTKGTEATIETMNQLAGRPFPAGGTVEEPRGVLVLGDLVDDVREPANWRRYTELFDVRGQGRLRYPVYELLGNHDLGGSLDPEGFNAHQREFIARNQSRLGTFHYDEHGYHYSWDWGQIHFVFLNIFPGNEPRPVYDRQAPWNDPQHSLDFLRADLAAHVGDSGRPVVLCWHYGLEGWGLEKWWTTQDLDNLKRTIQPYNIVLILHGHEHAYRRYQWEGYDVVMAPAPQIDPIASRGETEGRPKGFLVIRFQGKRMDLAHWTAGGWRETWSKDLRAGKAVQAPLLQDR